MCAVPNLVGQKTKDAQDIWGKGKPNSPGAGFLTNVIFDPLSSGNGYTIGRQTIPAGESHQCSNTLITVRP
jgi:hypothetical protein